MSWGSGFVNNNLCNLIESQVVRSELSSATVTVHNTLSLLSMVNSGKWVTILPETVAQIMADRLAFRRIEGLTARRTVSLLTRDHSRQQELVDDLRNIVRQLAPRSAVQPALPIRLVVIGRPAALRHYWVRDSRRMVLRSP